MESKVERGKNEDREELMLGRKERSRFVWVPGEVKEQISCG